jgi:hypothetical protein
MAKRKNDGAISKTGYYTGLAAGKIGKIFGGVDIEKIKDKTKETVDLSRTKVGKTVEITKDKTSEVLARSKEKYAELGKGIKAGTSDMINSFKAGYDSCKEDAAPKVKTTSKKTIKAATSKTAKKMPVDINVEESLEEEIAKIDKELEDL